MLRPFQIEMHPPCPYWYAKNGTALLKAEHFGAAVIDMTSMKKTEAKIRKYQYFHLLFLDS